LALEFTETRLKTNDAIWAGELGQKIKKQKNGKKRHQGWELHLYGDTPPLNVQKPNLA